MQKISDDELVPADDNARIAMTESKTIRDVRFRVG
jgi:hypothetical protein